MSRQFIDASQDVRCVAIITLRDKTTADCGRCATDLPRKLCTQHARIADRANVEVEA
jgi:hypothetical protein